MTGREVQQEFRANTLSCHCPGRFEFVCAPLRLHSPQPTSMYYWRGLLAGHAAPVSLLRARPHAIRKHADAWKKWTLRQPLPGFEADNLRTSCLMSRVSAHVGAAVSASKSSIDAVHIQTA
eukprot:1138005-Pelagomonas_calceolata.AAC.1